MEVDLCAAESGADVDSLGPECEGCSELAAGCNPAGADERNRELLCALWMASTAPVKTLIACHRAHGTADSQEEEQEEEQAEEQAEDQQAADQPGHQQQGPDPASLAATAAKAAGSRHHLLKLERLFVHALTWSLGGLLEAPGQAVFDAYLGRGRRRARTVRRR